MEHCTVVRPKIHRYLQEFVSSTILTNLSILQILPEAGLGSFKLMSAFEITSPLKVTTTLTWSGGEVEGVFKINLSCSPRRSCDSWPIVIGNFDMHLAKAVSKDFKTCGTSFWRSHWNSFSWNFILFLITNSYTIYYELWQWLTLNQRRSLCLLS